MASYDNVKGKRIHSKRRRREKWQEIMDLKRRKIEAARVFLRKDGRAFMVITGNVQLSRI